MNATSSSDDDDEEAGDRQNGRRFTLAVPITDPLGLRPGSNPVDLISF